MMWVNASYVYMKVNGLKADSIFSCVSIYFLTRTSFNLPLASLEEQKPLAPTFTRSCSSISFTQHE